eukprot:TRINITY_DN3486_c0_g1_i1.p2 TRINITY_DN3486_c0_g1~~TRINITY_DN3486_c0_g1_i1.p2  ORF type:complete len:473 (+),score=144.23 TRINITY_DN3486_c0_g1_i1:60-1421(+)
MAAAAAVALVAAASPSPFARSRRPGTCGGGVRGRPPETAEQVYAAASLPSAEVPVVSLRDVAEFRAYLAGEEFRSQYFERQPVLLRLETRAPPVNTSGSILEELLSHTYTVMADPRRGDHRTALVVPLTPEGEGALLAKRVSRLPSRKPGARLDGDAIRSELDTGSTVVLGRAALHTPALAELLSWVSDASGRITNGGVYITKGAGARESTAAHNDQHCVLAVQLSGAKGWRLWHKPAVALATHRYLHFGKDPETALSAARLGAPTYQLTIEAGDVLYIPRGVIHAASTADLPETTVSAHITASIEPEGVLLSQLVGGQGFLWLPSGTKDGSPRFARNWAAAVEHTAKRRAGLRKSLPPAYASDPSSMREVIREELHAVVDELVDGPHLAELVAEAAGAMDVWRRVFASFQRPQQNSGLDERAEEWIRGPPPASWIAALFWDKDEFRAAQARS